MPTRQLAFNSLDLGRAQLWAAYGAIVVFAAWALVALYWPRETAPVPLQEGGKDLQAYRRIVERVHHGENYYSAAGEELRVGGYATSSVFNWRLPTYAWLLGLFPRPEWGQALLCALALAALGVTYSAECRNCSVGRAAFVVLLMLGAFLWCIDGDAFFSQELWAGVLIALSVSAFAMNWRGVGVAAGLAALMMRELALPYVMIGFVLACREKQWKEVAVWCAGLAVFAAFLLWHAWQAHQQFTGMEHADAEGWIQFGGPAFVVQTCRMNLWLFKLPVWVALVFLMASAYGFTRWHEPAGLRVGATVTVYMLAFLVVGKPDNIYWGLLYVPLLPMALVQLAAGLYPSD